MKLRLYKQNKDDQKFTKNIRAGSSVNVMVLLEQPPQEKPNISS